MMIIDLSTVIENTPFEPMKIKRKRVTYKKEQVIFGSSTNGKKSKSIEELPIEWFYGNGIKLDLRHKGKGEFITKQDIQEALASKNLSIHENDIVLIWTGMEEAVNMCILREL